MGKIVKQGIPDAHKCSAAVAPGRPYEENTNVGTVWQCDCGKFYVVKTCYDDDGSYRAWVPAKNADGERYRLVERWERHGLFWRKVWEWV